MRRINAWLFLTLDGVMEAPEKWVMPDERMFREQTEAYAESDALLLGRRTYETFAASWPQRGSDVDNADWMNNTRKYVASSTLERPEWQNTTVLGDDVRGEVARLKEETGKNITVNGSATLVRSLIGWGLLDELRLYLHPLVLGSGAPLFERSGDSFDLQLSEARPYDNGVVALVYHPRQKPAPG